MNRDIKNFKDHIRFIKGEVEKGLKKLPLNDIPEYLYGPIRYSLSGKAKRLRPVLVHLSGKAFSVDPSILMKTSLAAELLHNFTLVHDDVMDNDKTRHGQKTVHEKWDIPTAILSGDGLYVLSQLLLSELNSIIHQRFNETSLILCEGQALDKSFEHESNITFEKYIDMVGRKTGTLLGLCSELGGRLSGQSNSRCKELNRYGFTLGLAFQVQDDILEIFGEASTMGKTLGSDISSGKQTALTLLAEKNDSEGWKQFRGKALALKEEERMVEFCNYFKSMGILDQAKGISKKYFDESFSSLEAFPENGRSELKHFINYVMNRTF